MSKLISFLFFNLLLNISAPSQVLVHQFFPMGINGDILGDTLINKREILRKAGIRKINVREVAPVMSSTYTSKIYSVNKHGDIESMKACFSNPKSDSGFCLNDTFSYNSKGQLTKLKSYGGNGAMYLQYDVEWFDDNSAKCYSNPVVKGDSLIDYKYYDERGRMLKQTSIRKGQEPRSSFYFYNKDGLLDSVRYDNSPLPTAVFKRKQQKKNTLVEWEHQRGKISWTYNSSGQCIKIIFHAKNQAQNFNQPYVFSKPRPEYIRNMEVYYYYNFDGTLSKITHKSPDKTEQTFTYTYENY